MSDEEATGYDSSKDKILVHLGSAELTSGATVEASINSYDGGEPRLRLIQRKTRTSGKKAGAEKINPLRNMTEEQALAVVKILGSAKKLAEHFDSAKKRVD